MLRRVSTPRRLTSIHCPRYLYHAAIKHPKLNPIKIPRANTLSRQRAKFSTSCYHRSHIITKPVPGMEGKLHLYHSGRQLNLLEFTPLPTTETPVLPFQTPPNVLLFVGGLFDNFGTPAYVSDIADLFPRYKSQKWAVMHVQLSSAMKGWGVSNLDRDIDEIATCINYIRSSIRPNLPTNIVLMGHSTGCQDTVHYLHAPNPALPKQQTRPAVQGAILQAPVSDREAVMGLIQSNPTAKSLYEKCVDLASRTPEENWPSTLLPTTWTYPIYHPAPLSIFRFMSLSSPSSPESPSQDDLFSSDLSDSRLASTFGKIYSTNLLLPPNVPPQMLILISGSDAAMPSWIDKSALLSRWSSTLESSTPSSSSESSSSVVDKEPKTSSQPLHAQSKVIPNAVHDISGSSTARQRARLIDMRTSVVKYLADVVGDIDESVYRLLKEDEEKIIQQEKTENELVETQEKVEKTKL